MYWPVASVVGWKSHDEYRPLRSALSTERATTLRDRVRERERDDDRHTQDGENGDDDGDDGCRGRRDRIGRRR